MTPRELPILFTGWSVRRILAGEKTQTRRAMDPQPWIDRYDGSLQWGKGSSSCGYLASDAHAGQAHPDWALKAPYQPGDLLYVRETWGLWDTEPKDGPVGATVFYRATDGDRHDLRHQLWRPSIHMPKWAARLWLRVLDVRAERVQEISGEDCREEGVRLSRCGCEVCAHSPVMCPSDASAHIMEFGELWDSINARRGYPWDSNPWVWAYTFERTETP